MATSPTSDALYGSDKAGNFDEASTPTSEATNMETPELSSPISETPEERAQRITELKEELEKVEGEIAMLRQVLGSKVRHATELKRQIGITPFQEFKQDLQTGFQQIKNSDSYQKTSAVVKSASEKTSSAINTMGQAVAKKMGDIKNSQTFKSFDEKVHNTYANVKAKVTGSRSSDEIDEALRDAQVTPDGQVLKQEDSNSNSPSSPPEEKVPL